MTMKTTRRLGALTLLIVGGVHLQQYLAGYSDVPTIGTLFLLNAIGAAVVAVGLMAPFERLVSDRRADLAAALLSALGAMIAIGALIALFISESQPLFGFMEDGYSTAIMIAIASEAITTILLAAVAAANLGGLPRAMALASRVLRARTERRHLTRWEGREPGHESWPGPFPPSACRTRSRRLKRGFAARVLLVAERSGLTPRASESSSAIRWTMTVSGNTDSASPSSRCGKRATCAPVTSTAAAIACVRSAIGPPPSSTTSVSCSSSATLGPWKNCSAESPSAAT